MKVPPNIVSTQKLQMYDVVNPAGEDLGQVQTLMMDMARLLLCVMNKKNPHITPKAPCNGLAYFHCTTSIGNARQ